MITHPASKSRSGVDKIRSVTVRLSSGDDGGSHYCVCAYVCGGLTVTQCMTGRFYLYVFVCMFDILTRIQRLEIYLD